MIPPLIALLPHDAEVAQLEPPAVADEHVQRREIAVEHLPAMEFSEDLQDARDLAACGAFRPAAPVALEERAEIAMPRVLDRQTVEHPCVPPVHLRMRKGVEHTNRAWMVVEQLPEVRLAQPAADVRTHLDAQRLGDRRRSADARGEVDLSEAALADEQPDPVSDPGFRADDELVVGHQTVWPWRSGMPVGGCPCRGLEVMVQHSAGSWSASRGGPDG